MYSYDGTTDPDEHIENIEAVLTYRSVHGAVKCKLFVTMLRRGAVTWFKNLRRNSIDSNFTEYTPLAMSRGKILAEIVVADLTEAGVQPPKAPSEERKGVDQTKYCQLHKCHGHNTDDCIHLKDAIELLIQRGRLKQFIKNPEAER